MKSQKLSARQERRLNAVSRHVRRYWLPANVSVANEMRAKLHKGEYLGNPNLLISDAVRDIAIFTRLLANLQAKDRLHRPGEKKLLTELIEEQGDDILTELEDALEVTSSTPHEHLEDSQLEALERTFVSASAAKLLAPNFKVGPTRAYLTSILRQLGLLLIEWNYPNLMAEKPRELSPEEFINKRLGFSPETLSASLLEPLHQVEWFNSVVRQSDQSEETLALSKVCSIGEALARANAPEHYPSASEDWTKVRDSLQQELGGAALLKVEEQTRWFIERQLRGTEYEDYSESLIVNPKERIRSSQRLRSLQDDSYVRKLPMTLQEELSELYLHCVPGEVSPQSIRRLLNAFVPKCGFTGGVIYLVDPMSMMLVPRSAFGNRSLEEFRKVDYAPSIDNTGIIASAFRSATKVANTETCPKLGIKAVAASVIGTRKRAGVLYLEFPANYLEVKPELMNAAFKVVLAALTHFFALSEQAQTEAGRGLH